MNKIIELPNNDETMRAIHTLLKSEYHVTLTPCCHINTNTHTIIIEIGDKHEITKW